MCRVFLSSRRAALAVAAVALLVPDRAMVNMDDLNGGSCGNACSGATPRCQNGKCCP
jgi:hypothetical protein